MSKKTIEEQVAEEIARVNSQKARVAARIRWKSKPFSYATDGESGVIFARSLGEAYSRLRKRITDEMLYDGATLWVEDENGLRETMPTPGQTERQRAQGESDRAKANAVEAA